MELTIFPITPEDREPIIDIINYYIAKSLVAYKGPGLTHKAFDILMLIFKENPNGTIKDNNGNILGFGYICPHYFSEIANLSYYIHHEHINKGIGKSLLEYLEDEGKKIGIKNILISIPSINSRSMDFHRKNGFNECNRFPTIDRINNQVFDLVSMQKML